MARLWPSIGGLSRKHSTIYLFYSDLSLSTDNAGRSKGHSVSFIPLKKSIIEIHSIDIAPIEY